MQSKYSFDDEYKVFYRMADELTHLSCDDNTYMRITKQKLMYYFKVPRLYLNQCIDKYIDTNTKKLTLAQKRIDMTATYERLKLCEPILFSDLGNDNYIDEIIYKIYALFDLIKARIESFAYIDSATYLATQKASDVAKQKASEEVEKQAVNAIRPFLTTFITIVTIFITISLSILIPGQFPWTDGRSVFQFEAVR